MREAGRGTGNQLWRPRPGSYLPECPGWSEIAGVKKEEGLEARGDASTGTVVASWRSCRGRDPGKPSQTPTLCQNYRSRGLLHMGVIMGSFGDMAREGSRAQDLGQFGGSETRAAPWLH